MRLREGGKERGREGWREGTDGGGTRSSTTAVLSSRWGCNNLNALATEGGGLRTRELLVGRPMSQGGSPWVGL